MVDATRFRNRAHLRWADIDANFHLRHTVYMDLGAQQRMAAFAHYGLTMDDMQRLFLGPVLFREEAHYRGEIRLTDEVWIATSIGGLSKNYRKFNFHHSFESLDGKVLATIDVDCAWIDTRRRKVIVPPELAVKALDGIPKKDEFVWL